MISRLNGRRGITLREEEIWYLPLSEDLRSPSVSAFKTFLLWPYRMENACSVLWVLYLTNYYLVFQFQIEKDNTKSSPFTVNDDGPVSLTILTAEATHLTTSILRKKGFLWAQSLKLKSNMEWKAWLQECGAGHYITSTVMKQRQMNVLALIPLSFLCSWGPQPRDAVSLQLGLVFLFWTAYKLTHR